MSVASEAVAALRSATNIVVGSYLSLAEGYATVVADARREREQRRRAEQEAEQLGQKLAEAHELIRRLQSAVPAFGEETAGEVLAAFEAGEKSVMAVPWERVALGVCPGCDKVVYSGDRFNMHRLAWGADFTGDRPGERLVFTHRSCGNGDHSRDGV